MPKMVASITTVFAQIDVPVDWIVFGAGDAGVMLDALPSFMEFFAISLLADDLPALNLRGQFPFKIESKGPILKHDVDLDLRFDTADEGFSDSFLCIQSMIREDRRLQLFLKHFVCHVDDAHQSLLGYVGVFEPQL